MKKQQINDVWQGKERCKNCAIRHLVLFSDLDHEDFDRMHLPIDDLQLEPGTRLYHQGDDVAYVYTVRSGLIKLVQYLPNGGYRIVRILQQGDLAGLEMLTGKKATHEAISLDNVQLCRIPRSVIDKLGQDTPRLHNALMQRWQRALMAADEWITQLTTGAAKFRVARLLLLLDENSQDDIFFLPTREDIGAMLGITTESASKVTAEFRRKEWLKPLENSRAWIDSAQMKAYLELD